MTFLYDECINIYTDASCKELDTVLGKVSTTCSGFIPTYKGHVLGVGLEVYIDEYAIFGEAKAVQMATQWILNNQSRYTYHNNRPTAINIFSDNNAVVGKVNSYLAKWLSLLERNNGEPVVLRYDGDGGMTSWNYAAYMAAVDIIYSHLPVRVFYTPGHMNIWNGKLTNAESAKNKMVEINTNYHGDISEEIESYIIHEAATFNNVADITTRNYLYRNKYNIEASINALKTTLVLGPHKPCTIVWPFVFPTPPAALQQPDMYMIGDRLMQKQAAS